MYGGIAFLHPRPVVDFVGRRVQYARSVPLFFTQDLFAPELGAGRVRGGQPKGEGKVR